MTSYLVSYYVHVDDPARSHICSTSVSFYDDGPVGYAMYNYISCNQFKSLKSESTYASDYELLVSLRRGSGHFQGSYAFTKIDSQNFDEISD